MTADFHARPQAGDASTAAIVICPGQGAQHVGMGRAWHGCSPAARAIFEEADAVLRKWGGAFGNGAPPLSQICFEGPAETLNRTDISQPAIYTCSIASFMGLIEQRGKMQILATAGLSLGEYTALHLARAFDFATGLKLVATRGRLMQEAAETSRGSMVALIGADEQQAGTVCDRVLADEQLRGRMAGERPVLVCANFNAPGQIVLSGSMEACERALEIAADLGLRATPLTVAGAFHSPLMQPAADQMRQALASVELAAPTAPVYSNVTAQPHVSDDLELLRERLIQQIVSPVRWAQTCEKLASSASGGYDWPYYELAPGTVLRGLMRRIDRQIKVTSHDEPTD